MKKSKRFLSLLLTALLIVSLLPMTAMAANSSVSTSAELMNALESSGNRTIELTDDIVMECDPVISNSGTVTLDLKGHVIEGSSGHSFAYLYSGSATLTIKDTEPTVEHRFDTSVTPWKLDENGDTVVTGGVITGFSSGNATITLGLQGDKLIMEGGNIVGNENTSVDSSNSRYGGAVGLGRSTCFTMNGGRILGNKAQYGGGIFMTGSEATLSVSGNAEISRNSATEDGGGILAYQGSITISNSSIVGNSAGENGGGIYATNDDIMEITNSIITGNTARTGGGVYFGNNYRCLDVGGASKIIGNVSGGTLDKEQGIYTGSVDSNLYLSNPNIANSRGGIGFASTPLSGEAQIGVSISNVNPLSSPKAIAMASENNYSQYFVADPAANDPDRGVVYNMSNKRLEIGYPPTVKVTRVTDAQWPVIGTEVENYALFNFTPTNYSEFTPGELSVQWKNGNDWGATSPAGITLSADGKVTTTADAAVDDYVFRVADSTNSVFSKPTTLTVEKKTYDGTKTTTGEINGTLTTAQTITLPALPAGASYDTSNITDFSDYGTASVSGTTLTLELDSTLDEGMDDIEITVPVTGATEYKDYEVTVTVTPEFPKIPGLLYFTATGGDVELGMASNKSGNAPYLHLVYSEDGTIWEDFIYDVYPVYVGIEKGHTIYLRSADEDECDDYDNYSKDQISAEDAYWYFTAYSTDGGKLKVGGDLMSLLNDHAVPDGAEFVNVENSAYAFSHLFDAGGIDPRQSNTGETNMMSSILVDASKLTISAEALPEGCCSGMFYGCDELKTGPTEINATSVGKYCCYRMFSGCDKLTNAPALPATNLAERCYDHMFNGCKNLKAAPATLPATTLADYCYSFMFNSCESLENAPALPATTLAEGCYNEMFGYCTSLANAPELPATTLAKDCYCDMFYLCTSLTTAPELPATTLAEGCYCDMFSGCTALTTAPAELPATTLAKNCYQWMFDDCAALTTAPKLPATTLVNGCYDGMFEDCTLLNSIEVGFTAWDDTPAGTEGYTNATNGWVKNVAATGNFVCPATLDNRGRFDSVDGVPIGWTINGRYAVFGDADENGNTVKPSTAATDATWAYYAKDADVTVTATPVTGFQLKSVSYQPSGAEQATTITPASGVYTFKMPAKHVTLGAEFVHAHSFTYEAEGNVLTATCSVANCTLEDSTATLTLTAQESLVYDTAAKVVDFLSDAWTTAAELQLPTVEYYLADGTTKTTAENSGAASEGAAPAHAGSYVAKVTVDSATATLEFEITRATPTLTGVTATPISYEQTLTNSTVTGTATNENMQSNKDVAGTFAFTAGTTAPAVSDSDTTEYGVTFTPTDTKNYNSNTCEITLTVGKAIPAIITPPTASTIAYGETLAKSVLEGGEASVPGSFAWTNGTTVPSVKTANETGYSVTFTPTDAANYAEATGMVKFTVSKSTQTAPEKGEGYTVSSGKLKAKDGYEILVKGAAPLPDPNPTTGEIIPDDSHTYYARKAANDNELASAYTDIGYTVTFNLNDENGFGNCAQKTKVIGVASTKYGTLPTPTHPYAESFDGWYTAATGGDKVTAETTAPNAAITLYAHWTFKSFNVSSGGGHNGAEITGEKTAAYNPYGGDYTFTLPNDGVAYGVTITIGGQPYYTTPTDRTYTIEGEAITGDIVITLKVLPENYVTLTYYLLTEGSATKKAVKTLDVVKTDDYPTEKLPTKKGYNVKGWYTDEACTQLASGKVETGKPLYAMATLKEIPYEFVNVIDGVEVTYAGGGENKAKYGTTNYFPDDPIQAYKHFLGWQGDNGVVVLQRDGGYSYKMPDVESIKFTSMWKQVGDLIVIVKDTDGNLVPGADVTLVSNSQDIATTKTGTADDTTIPDIEGLEDMTTLEGVAIFRGLDYGAYNVRVTSGISDGDKVITTAGRDVTGNANKLTVEVPTYKLNTLVDSSELGLNLTADGLNGASKNKPEEGQELIVTLTATLPGEEEKTEILAKVTEDVEKSTVKVEMVDFVDLKVSKQVNESGSSGEKENLKTTDDYQYISIEISKEIFDALMTVDGSPDYIAVYHRHENNDNTNVIARLSKVRDEAAGRSANKDCYWIKNVEGKDYIVIKTKNFSVYAFGVQDSPVQPDAERSSGGGGSTSYSITGEDSENGKLTVSSRYAYAGQTVTITATPEEGYKLNALTVKDAKGNVLTLTKVNDTTYTFKMPASAVTVSAAFAKIGACPQDATCVYAKFTDADTKAWYHDGVHFCVENGYMQGVSATAFDPSGNTTRAMIVTMLWRMEGEPVVNYAMSFKDVKADQWYTEAIRWAQSTGVVDGYSAEAFGPDDPITREQMATILYRYAKYHSIGVTNTNTLAGFTDVNKVSTWALDAMKWANAVGLVQGRTTTTLVPEVSITRAEAATMVQRYCEKVSDK